MRYYYIRIEGIQMEDYCVKDFKRVSIWGRMIGSLLILYGIYLSIQGLYSYIIGAMPGVAAIIIGKYIYDTGKESQEFIKSKGKNVSSVHNMMRSISLTLLVIGILMIIVLYVLFFLISLYYS